MKYEIEKNSTSVNEDYNVQVPIFKVESSKRLVYGKVLVPETIDKHEDIILKEDVERVAHEFMMNLQMPFISDIQGQIRKSEIGYMHTTFGLQDVFIVESYVDQTDGSWVLVTKILNDDLWNKVQSGEITGYSIGGVAERVPVVVNAD